MTLGDWDRRFASVIDSGLFHVYSGDDRRRYVQGLTHVVQPGGRLFLYAFSDEEPAAPGGGVSAQDLYDSFADGWEVESVEPVQEKANPESAPESPDGYLWKMRFAIIRRKE
jgi:hypothetical protein